MRPRVVIIGGGFGGLYAARALRTVPVDVTVIDRTNHHLFQPLLYQVALATLAPSDIAAPIRWLLRKQLHTRVVLGDVQRVDVERRVVQLDDAQTFEYDYLIVAAGARHSYFAHPEWESRAPGLKSLDDAIEIRRRFLLAYESAESTDDQTTRDELMTFVVVGAGPTGVELAGLIPDIVTHAFRRDFRRVDPARTRVVLIEAGPRILASFPESLSAASRRDLERLGIEVRTSTFVTQVDDHGVVAGGERIATRTVFWAAGNAASPLGAQLGAPLDRAGRVIVEPDLSIPTHPEVFVIGDLAAVSQNGALVPGVAPAAMQGGRHAAKTIARALRGEPSRPFRYVDKGNLATIGRHRAVADFANVGLRVHGPLAWWFWLFLHIMYLAGFRNRLSVLLQWGYAYLTYQRGVRLITGNQWNAPAESPSSAKPA